MKHVIGGIGRYFLNDQRSESNIMRTWVKKGM